MDFPSFGHQLLGFSPGTPTTIYAGLRVPPCPSFLFFCWSFFRIRFSVPQKFCALLGEMCTLFFFPLNLHHAVLGNLDCFLLTLLHPCERMLHFNRSPPCAFTPIFFAPFPCDGVFFFLGLFWLFCCGLIFLLVCLRVFFFMVLFVGSRCFFFLPLPWFLFFFPKILSLQVSRNHRSICLPFTSFFPLILSPPVREFPRNRVLP